jgi:dTDP-4-dehydrorhamnose 3,5-epimerase
MNIATSYAEKITTQSYSEKVIIDGVELIPLKLHTDDGGNFLELFRMSQGNVENLSAPFTAQQISMSIMVPGVVKAYHIHNRQDDLWLVPHNNRLLANLHDLREGSSTFDNHVRIVLGGGTPSLLRIPAGVAHGVKNCYDRDMTLIYATSEQFNASLPDEHRLPWDSFGTDVWDLQKG